MMKEIVDKIDDMVSYFNKISYNGLAENLASLNQESCSFTDF